MSGLDDSSVSLLLDSLDVGAAESSTSPCGALTRRPLGGAVEYPAGTAVGPAVAPVSLASKVDETEPPRVPESGSPVGVNVARIETG